MDKIPLPHVVQAAVLATGVGFGWMLNKKYHKGKAVREQFVNDVENYTHANDEG